MGGKSVIADGKAEGDSVSFNLTVQFQDNEIELKYTGKVNGNAIKVHVESDGGMALDYVANKVS